MPDPNKIQYNEDARMEFTALMRKFGYIGEDEYVTPTRKDPYHNRKEQAMLRLIFKMEKPEDAD